MRRKGIALCGGLLLALVLAGCRAGPGAEEPQYQVTPVQRGDVVVDVTSSGNLVYAHREELSFAASGRVGEVLVEVGDSVEEGQVLARLDEQSVISLQKAVIQARINLENVESVTELDVAQAEAAVADARVALEAAQEALERAENPYSEADIARAELAVVNAEIALDMAEDNFERAEQRHQMNPTVPQWAQEFEKRQKELAVAEFDLAEAEETLAEMKAGADRLEVEQRQKQLAVAQARLKEAEEELAEVLGSVDSLEVELKQWEVASARAALDEAMEALETATMVAPFAGIVTLVNIEAGQAVKAGQVVIELADPTRFEATMLVNEIDILKVQVGDGARIEVDALPGVDFPGRVARITPTAAAQQGVVNYRVTVELETLAPLEREASVGQQGQPADEEAIDEVLEKAVAEGRLTQEQADVLRERLAQAPVRVSAEQLEHLIERISQSGGDLGLGGGLSQDQLEQLRQRFQQGQGAALAIGGQALEGVQLREGLSVTVTIITQQRSDVLIVPNRAISLEGSDTYVEVLKGDAVERRLVVTGLADWQNTEIVQGLSEGELVITGRTESEPSSSEEQPRSFRLFPRPERRPER